MRKSATATAFALLIDTMFYQACPASATSCLGIYIPGQGVAAYTANYQGKPLCVLK